MKSTCWTVWVFEEKLTSHEMDEMELEQWYEYATWNNNVACKAFTNFEEAREYAYNNTKLEGPEDGIYTVTY